MTGNEIRSLFLEYFKKKDHHIVKSSSLVPFDDPTLLFVNAGMVPFKRVFLGEDKKNYNKAVSSQKCVRAGGKHNDLENVGYTARHHTFFEMLGNFSFGDYFKEKAIFYSWDLITNIYKLDKSKLWISVYQDDDKAEKIWQDEIGVLPEKIVKLGEVDNFWAMGDTGPCGPCSEIYYDRGKKIGCLSENCMPGCDCDRFTEIWNLVFMQFNRDNTGKLTPLPKPSIDTGMGLERICSVIQNVSTNYDIDLIKPIMDEVSNIAAKNIQSSKKQSIAAKVIADHSRAAVFLISDGVLPSNEQRGYVLRRIMRRAIRYGRNLDLKKPFLYKTAQKVIDIMNYQYPELNEAKDLILKVIKNEETRFSETLENGLKILNETIYELKAKNENKIPGKTIFKLYDTYGFPVDIVKDVLKEEKNLTLDLDGFKEEMEIQKQKAKAKVSFTQANDNYKNLSATGMKPEFVGYNQIKCDSKVLLIVEGNCEIDKAENIGQKIEIVTEKTPFYGNSGGQVGDIGTISSINNELEIKIYDTIKDPNNIIIHKGELLKGYISKDDNVMLTVDDNHRNAVKCNHTATHLLHFALRKVLGKHVKQSGSLVEPLRLRFDFTHFSLVDKKDLNKIETLVNKYIRENISVKTKEMDQKKAQEEGATALFEEKYGDVVRVVSIDPVSKELCGGTHTNHTGDIGLFKILSESSIASGIRRIEAITGNYALEFIQNSLMQLNEIGHILKEKPDNITKKLKTILEEQKNLEKEVSKLRIACATTSTDDTADNIKTINSIKVISQKVNIKNPSELRDIADQYKDKIKSGVVVLASIANEKVLFVVVVTKDLTKKYNAGKIAKEIAGIVGGNGGGRPDMAQAGGTNIAKLDEALMTVYDIIADGLS